MKKVFQLPETQPINSLTTDCQTHNNKYDFTEYKINVELIPHDVVFLPKYMLKH